MVDRDDYYYYDIYILHNIIIDNILLCAYNILYRFAKYATC